jgi:hypothetical protein
MLKRASLAHAWGAEVIFMAPIQLLVTLRRRFDVCRTR